MFEATLLHRAIKLATKHYISSEAIHSALRLSHSRYLGKYCTSQAWESEAFMHMQRLAGPIAAATAAAAAAGEKRDNIKNVPKTLRLLYDVFHVRLLIQNEGRTYIHLHENKKRKIIRCTC